MTVDRRVRFRALLAAVLAAGLTAGTVQGATAATAPTEQPSAAEVAAAPRAQWPAITAQALGGDVSTLSAPDAPAARSAEAEPTGVLHGSTILEGGVAAANVDVYAFHATDDPESPYEYVTTVVTDEQGQYRFEALPTGGYDLLFVPRDPAYAWQWSDGGATAAPFPPVGVSERETGLGPIQLSTPFPFGGNVKNELTGTAVAGAEVTLWASRGPDSDEVLWFEPVDTLTTDAAGRYDFAQVPHGYYLVQFASAGYKGEWFQNKPDFATSNIVRTFGRTSYTASAALTPRVSLGTVAVSGSSAVGSKLTATHTVISGAAYRYTWLADGVAIPGATAKTFVPTAAQEHKLVTVRVKGMKTGMISTTATSAPRGKVLMTSMPKITGKTAIDARGTSQFWWKYPTLTAWKGTWTSGATIRYQWYRDGKAIESETAPTYTLSAGDRDKRISVKVTGSKDGYGTFARTSAATPRIALIGMAFVEENPSVPRGLQSQLIRFGIYTSGAFTAGSQFTYYFYADGVLVQSGPSDFLQRSLTDFIGKRLQGKVVVSNPGYATHTLYTATTNPVVWAP
ncbi:carboxypeptidase regulatory-like domain-containing protein [Microbacterium sp. NPDC019599]|uniref:carboxypeptidase regulatory-like domain-containing protein n=1 Tax=Microbacterium sp. NPDC019599 TaxID=3154690 RepID=UPI0033EBF5BF